MRPEKKPTEFGNRLRAVREALGLTREELAALSGVVKETIRNFELGYFRVGRASAMSILRALATLDSGRAVYVAQALDTPANIIQQLGLLLEKVEPPGPIQIGLKVDASQNVTLQADSLALGRLIAYAARRARQDRDRPDGGALCLTLTINAPGSPRGKAPSS